VARSISGGGLRRTAILAGVLLACSAGPWVSAAPVVFRPAELEPYVIVARCVDRAQELGYSVNSVDYDAGWVRLAALTDHSAMLGMRPVPRSSSWLLVKVGDDRTVSVRAYGDLVREKDGRMDPGLRAEMDWLAGELERVLSDDSPTSEDDAEP